MTTMVQIKVPITGKQATDMEARGLDDRLRAVAHFHDSGLADKLADYDPMPSMFAITKERDAIVYRVVLDRPLDSEDGLEIVNGFETKLLFLMRGIDFDSSWSGFTA